MSDPTHPLSQFYLAQTRRHFFSTIGRGIGAAALGSLLSKDGLTAEPSSQEPFKRPHFAPRAKRVIYLFQSGGPSQMDLFDYKPMMDKVRGQDLPTPFAKDSD